VLVKPFGESGWLIEPRDCRPSGLAAALRQLGRPDIEDVVASYETVAVFGPIREDGLLKVIAEALLSGEAAGEPKLIRVPVCYEMGPDWPRVAGESARGGWVASQLSMAYEWFAVGFQPGFAYLGYLPHEIAQTARLSSPRTAVPAGSVAIAGRQTAVYPSASPGGWNLIGRTPLILVDVEDDFFPIAAGDRVQFYRIDESEFSRLEGVRLA